MAVVETGAGAVSLREATWLACPAKSCCHAAVVVPTGRDVWRIARALEVPPWSFLRYFATPQPTGDAFALDAGERRYRLVPREPDSRKKKPPCILLTPTRPPPHQAARRPPARGARRPRPGARPVLPGRSGRGRALHGQRPGMHLPHLEHGRHRGRRGARRGAAARGRGRGVPRGRRRVEPAGHAG